jgi:hypothetical protein
MIECFMATKKSQKRGITPDKTLRGLTTLERNILSETKKRHYDALKRLSKL